MRSRVLCCYQHSMRAHFVAIVAYAVFLTFVLIGQACAASEPHPGTRVWVADVRCDSLLMHEHYVSKRFIYVWVDEGGRLIVRSGNRIYGNFPANLCRASVEESRP